MRKPPSGIHLSEEDVRLLTADKSTDNRAAVAEKIGRQIDGKLSDEERTIAEDILRALARDVAITVRTALAESLKASPSLPKDVAMTLARDVEAVALPFLTSTPALNDEELIQVVTTGSSSKQEAVAQRSNLSSKVADALVEHASEQAVATLMSNITAQVTPEGYGRALDRFPSSDTVQGSILKRKTTLPETITRRLVTMVSDQLLDYLVARQDVPEEVASDMLLRTRERAAMQLFSDEEADTNGLEDLVKRLDDAGHLNGSLLLRAICMGDLDFFEMGLARLSGLPVINARLLIYDEGPLGLKTIFERSNLPLSLLPASRAALTVVRETLFDGEAGDIERRRRKVLERVLTQVDALGDDDLHYLIDKLDSLAPINFMADAQQLADGQAESSEPATA